MKNGFPIKSADLRDLMTDRETEQSEANSDVERRQKDR